MTREASVATLRRLAEAADRWIDEKGPIEMQPRWTADTKDFYAALNAYRSEIAPLRTETEVVLDIGHHIRACVRMGQVMMTAEEKAHLEALANEHTAPAPAPAPGRWRVGTRVPEHVYLDDKPICTMPSADLARAVVAAMNSGPSSADAEEVPSPRPPASPAGADYSMSNARNTTLLACALHVLEGCSEDDPNLSLEDRRALQAMMAVVMTGERDWPDLRKLRAECSGPPGAVAAKESRDNAAAPEGAALDACGCEEADRLNGYLKDISSLHRQWDRGDHAGSLLTQIGNVLLRWMSNLP